MRLSYPKATFPTLLCPASSKRAGFRGLRGYKTFLFFHHGKHGNARCATPKWSRRFASHYSPANCPQYTWNFLSLGLHPRPHAEGIYKNSKVLWNLCGYLIQKQLSQPFGVRRAPSEPVSVYSVVKNPASNFHFTKHPETSH